MVKKPRPHMVKRPGENAWGVAPDDGSEPIVWLTSKKLVKKWLGFATGKRYSRVDKLRRRNRINKELL